MRFVNIPKRPRDLFELALSGLGSLPKRGPLAFVSTGTTIGGLNESPGGGLAGFATRVLGEGIRDGLPEVDDIMDGERPKAGRPEYSTPDLLSALEVSLS